MIEKTFDSSYPIASEVAIRQAWSAVENIESATGVTIFLSRTAAHSHAVSQVLAQIWPQNNGGSQLTANLLRALEFSGNYVSLAMVTGSQRTEKAAGADEDNSVDRIVGACVGFFGPPTERHLHSHMAGVTSGMIGHGVGRALKLHQRAWALERTVTEISWTFDPLVARNAHFNLERLGAHVPASLPDFYGPMSDLRNVGQDSDRLVATWRLLDERVVALSAGEARPFDSSRHLAGGAREWITVVDNEPLVAEDRGAHSAGSSSGLGILRIPSDFEGLRRNDAALAARWRRAAREGLAQSVGSGRWRIVGFEKHIGYLLEALS